MSAWQTMLTRCVRHPGDDRAMQRLVVEATLAGDHQVAVVECSVKPGDVADEVDAGGQPPTAGENGRAQATGSTGARDGC